MKKFIIAKLENNYLRQSVNYRMFSYEDLEEEISNIIDGQDRKNGTAIKDGKLYIYGANFYNKYTDEFIGTNTVEVTLKFTDKFIDRWDYDRVEDFIKNCEELFNSESEILELKV